MKKSTLFTCAALALACLFVFTGCGPIKYSSAEGICLELPGFYAKLDVEGQTYCLQSLDVVFTSLRESKSTLSASDKEDYLRQVKSEKGMSENIVQGADGEIYIHYNRSVGGQEFFYMIFVKESAESFWLCQFLCLKEKEAEMAPKFFQWAKTIEVDK